MKKRILYSLCLISIWSLAGSFLAKAQEGGAELVGQSVDLGLDRDHASKIFSVQETSAPQGGVNVVWPGESAPVTLTISNLSDQPMKGTGQINVIHYAVHGRPSDAWIGKFVKLADLQSIPVNVDIPPHGSMPVQVRPAIPETFGGYALVVDLGGYGRRFGCSIARTLPADGGHVQIPAYALDIINPCPETFYLFKRLGVKGSRMEMAAPGLDQPQSPADIQAQDDLMKSMWDNEITTMLTVYSNHFPQALGTMRPFLNDNGVMNFPTYPGDSASMPANDADFQAWTKLISDKYGWPNGPINGMELWNEPWEGISISGWGADIIRYRALYSAMAKGIVASREQKHTNVLIGGASSTSNAMDKLFPDGNDTFLKWFDFSSIHYQPFGAVSALVPAWLNRKSPEGPVQSWDTESWSANCDDRIAVFEAASHSMGEPRAMGIQHIYVYSTETIPPADPQSKTPPQHIVQAWSTAACVAAVQKFIGQRKFHELLFKNGLPWVLVFDGLPNASGTVNPDDGTVVVVGDYSSTYDRNQLLFRDVYGLKNVDPVIAVKKQLAAASDPGSIATLTQQLVGAGILQDGTMTLANVGDKFVMKDVYGNSVPASNGQLTIPLNGQAYFVRTTGAPGSFQALLEGLRKSRIEGYEPISVQFHDFTNRIGEHPGLKLTVTNILNRPISGKLHLDVDHLQLGSDQTVALGANETKDVLVPIQNGTEALDNTYAAHLTFDAGADGVAQDDDTLHVNVIAHRTITVDGNLDDWKGVLPQPVAGAGISASDTQKAWLPFVKFDESVKTGVATGYLAYDDKNFYFAANIADSTPDPGMVRMATRDDDNYFYPEKSYLNNPTTAVGKKEGSIDAIPSSMGNRLLQLPTGAPDARSHTLWLSSVNTLGLDLALPAGQAHQVSLYLIDGDYPSGRCSVTIEAIDGDTGKVLDTQIAKDFLDGRYYKYRLSGNIKLRLTSQLSYLGAPLAGFFFDPTSDGASVAGTSAKFLAGDDKTRGNWKGVYGKDGYLVVGTPASYPAYVKVTVPEVMDKKELDWPAGVPRFSYRKNPDLPAGSGHDNVQIAFNILPVDKKTFLMNPPGTMPKYEVYPDSDYEYALDPVASAYGGGTEVWRMNCPGMPHKHFYPRQPKSSFEGPVKDAQFVETHAGNTRIVEAAIPWSEIPEVKKRLDAGETIKFSYRVNDNGGPSYELAANRSVSKINFLAFHNDFETHWANELEFKFEK